MLETLTLPLPKTLSGRYAIEQELGRAGLAVVHLARDLRNDRPVALKALPPEVTAAVGAERFLDEIRAAAGLEHPHILPLIDCGVAEGSIYYVTPLVDRGTLRDRLEWQPQLPIDEALRIAGRVAEALDFAHRRGVVHGDIKPEKIVLHDGEPLLTDFGIGRALTTAAGERLAQIGIFGTPAYMSPEQAVGDRAVDGRSDQYSLACVLYEMLAGEPPFTAPNADALIARVLTEPPPRLTAARVVPRIVERAIEKALSKSPSDRFRTVGEFAAALQGATTAPPPEARLAAAPRRRWRAPLAASLALLVVAAGVGVGSRAIINRRAATRPAAHRQLTFAGTATAPALSPDGRSVAYIAGGRSLLVQRLDGGRLSTLVPSAQSILAARWTGDGAALVVAMTRDTTEMPATYLVPAAGGRPRKVLDDWRPFDAGPDSTAIIRVPPSEDRIELVSLATGKTTRAVAVPDSIGPIGEIAWSPDGRWIAFTGAGDAVWVVSAAGGSSPSHVADSARAIRWAAGSDALYFLRGPAGAVDLMRVGVNPQSGRAATNPARVTSLLAADAFDIRGNRLVHTQTTPGPQARTFVVGGTPRQVIGGRPLVEGPARLSGVAISSDGLWIAYSASQGADRDIHVAPFAGGSARVVAGSASREEAPAWSPDGTRLSFVLEDSAGRRLVIADASTGAAERVSSVAGPGIPDGDSVGPRVGSAAGRWSASGRLLAYYAQDLRRIAVVNLQREAESIVRMPDSVGTGYFFVVPAPTGTQLLASTLVRPNEGAALWLVFGNGRRWRRIPGPFGEAFPVAWHRNGWIYLVRNRALATGHGSVHLELWRMRGPNGRPEFYAPLPEGCGVSVSISADGTRGVCNYIRVESDLYVASNFGAAAR